MFTIAGESLSDMELPIPQDPTHRTTSRKPKLYPVLLIQHMALIRETYLAQDLEGKLLLSMLNMTHHLLHQNTTIINSFCAQLVEQNAISTKKNLPQQIIKFQFL